MRTPTRRCLWMHDRSYKHSGNRNSRRFAVNNNNRLPSSTLLSRRQRTSEGLSTQLLKRLFSHCLHFSSSTTAPQPFSSQIPAANTFEPHIPISAKEAWNDAFTNPTVDVGSPEDSSAVLCTFASGLLHWQETLTMKCSFGCSRRMSLKSSRLVLPSPPIVPLLAGLLQKSTSGFSF